VKRKLDGNLFGESDSDEGSSEGSNDTKASA
jgi:hypothetical protein